MAVVWDPEQYLRYADERQRPFVELVTRIAAREPRRVVDLGCGPGNLTALLRRRWPGAAVEGIDSSPEMIGRADEDAATDGVQFSVGDVADWRPAPDVDVVVCNAVLQWVPEHRELLARWCGELRDGAWLAWQVPGNVDAPSHTLLRELAAEARWEPLLRGTLWHGAGRRGVDEPPEYAELLHRNGWHADAWETTYVHVLPGTDPVLEWVRGTTLRPVLRALEQVGGPQLRAEFEREYAMRLRAAYPPGPAGTLFPFRRVFVVGRR